MKILLTGGAGYIGSHTAIELKKAGHEIVIGDNFSNSKPDVLEKINQIVGQKIEFHEIDFTNQNDTLKLFEECHFDAVIHFAGLKAVGESCTMPIEYYKNNIDSTLNIVEAMKKYDVNNLVFSSSATVYGIPKKLPLKEGMPTSCTNPYGWTKLMNEQILTDVTRANPKFSVVLLRYFNPIGAHESGLIGEDPNGIPNNLMPYITKVAKGVLPELNVFGNDYPTKDGTGVRDYIHVVDLAKGHVDAIEYAEKHRGVEIFNLGTGVGYSVLDIVNTFSRVNNIKVPYRIAERRDGDVAECYADAGKAREVLNWSATKTLDDMCKDSWNFAKNN
ncbi:MAG: UDP-glucose 4-epimerase GalE [Clostridia bacterium]|nr:UDP-glucose 4-epimerase GalE [Clostridia bacterium]